MRAVIAYDRTLSFEGRYDGQTGVGLADDMALLLAHAISSCRSIVGAAVPCNIEWELLAILESSFLFFAEQELAQPITLDSDGRKHNRPRNRPID